MRIPLILIFIAVIVCPSVDIYIGRAISHRISRRPLQRGLMLTHIIISILAFALLAVGIFLPTKGGDDATLVAKMWLLFAFLTVYASKFLFVIIDLIASIPRLFRRGRWRFVSVAGAILGLALFVGMWHGALINRFRIQIREVTVDIPGLPSTFDGYRIAQISDIHSGTYGNDTTFLASLVDRANTLDVDMIAFTGDIVNRRSSELHPHVGTLSRLSAPDGVFAILGNHDYGDYYSWPSEEKKRENMTELYDMFGSMGWRLLLNETDYVCRGADSLAIIGVENIGDPPFPTYGSLEKAYPAGADGRPKILLSHNPAHWTDDLSNGKTPNDISLTLAGHTHAMQIELLGLSPAVFRYPKWGGLYNDGEGRSLYVNIGTGTVGLPMRLGATPEITVITLRAIP